MNKISVINVFYVSIVAFHANLDSFGGPDSHTFGLQLSQMDPTGAAGKVVDAFFGYILLVPEEASGTLNGNTPGFFLYHVAHLPYIIQQIS